MFLEGFIKASNFSLWCAIPPRIRIRILVFIFMRFRVRIQLSTLMQIQIQLPKIMRIRIRNTGMRIPQPCPPFILLLNFTHVLQDWLHPRVWVSGFPPGLLQPAARGVGQRSLSRTGRVHPAYQAHTQRDSAFPIALIALLCLSEEKKIIPVLRIRDVCPGSWILSIPDPGSNNSTKRGGKMLLSYGILVQLSCCKWLYFWTGKEKFFVDTVKYGPDPGISMQNGPYFYSNPGSLTPRETEPKLWYYFQSYVPY